MAYSHCGPDLHTVSNVHALAYTHPRSIADIHAVAHVYPVAYTNSYALPDTEGRADVHSVPDLHAMAYVDTDTCAYCYSDTDADTDADTGPDADTDARTISQIDSEHDIRVSGLDDTGDGTGLSEVRVCHGDDDGRGRPDDVELYICGRKWQF